VQQLPPRGGAQVQPAYLQGADASPRGAVQPTAAHRLAIEDRVARRMAARDEPRAAAAASSVAPLEPELADAAPLAMGESYAEPYAGPYVQSHDPHSAQPYDGMVIHDPGYVGSEPGCGLYEAGCGIVEPDCGVYEPGCACGEPTCGILDAGCGLAEPGCGIVDGSACGDVVCGSCVGQPGPDYWCFPVCLPRFKELQLWAGVHGFKGPRDSPQFGGPSDGNFGFQEGVNLGGRMPLLGLVFPQLSYQLGYQAVQSQLAGTSDPAPDGIGNDRSQHFITAGVFRRVQTGIQWGVVWDMLSDDFVADASFYQVRYEASIKSPRGREFGFLGMNHANSTEIDGVSFQTVDQFLFFYRWHFWHSGDGRLWGGFSDDSEGIFGGEFQVPLNNRWSLQTGFNYLITDQNAGRAGATEEAWNLGMNLVWHFGRTAKQMQHNPHRPLFQVADNGWMMIDQTP
jgi:hypothetical protein